MLPQSVVAGLLAVPAPDVADRMAGNGKRTGRIDWQRADLSGTGHCVTRICRIVDVTRPVYLCAVLYNYIVRLSIQPCRSYRGRPRNPNYALAVDGGLAVREVIKQPVLASYRFVVRDRISLSAER